MPQVNEFSWFFNSLIFLLIFSFSFLFMVYSSSNNYTYKSNFFIYKLILFF